MASKDALSAKKLREHTPEELETRLGETKKELFKYRVQAVTGELVTKHLIREKRRDVARINTIINEKKAATQAS